MANEHGETGFPVSSAGLLELMRTVLERGAVFRFRARGCSMFPFIRDRDIITIAPLNATCPGPGDVLAYVSPGAAVESEATGLGPAPRVVVHRVVGRRDELLVIQGDNQSPTNPGLRSSTASGQPDPAVELVPVSSLLGRVIRVERNGRTVRLGLGRERRVIAFLARSGMLNPLVRSAGGLKRLMTRESGQMTDDQ